MNGGEMSRFLYQIKYESGLTVVERNFQNPISTQNPKEIRIGKTPPILHILERYTRSEDQTISPSALNTYMECSLKFYFKYIAQIKEKEELAEGTGPPSFGKYLSRMLRITVCHDTWRRNHESGHRYHSGQRISDRRTHPPFLSKSIRPENFQADR